MMTVNGEVLSELIKALQIKVLLVVPVVASMNNV